MKIIYESKCETFWDVAGAFRPGAVVTMRETVNQYCKKADLYMINAIPPCYVKTDRGYENKVVVTNLRTGGVSLIDSLRQCMKAVAHVCVEKTS